MDGNSATPRSLYPPDVQPCFDLYRLRWQFFSGNGLAYEVEFTTLDGKMAAVVTVESSQVRPVGKREIAHARTLTVA